MAISIPCKSEKKASQLRDIFRILAWQQYKSDNPEIKGLEGYAEFDVEWQEFPVHQMNEAELIKFGKDLGYGIADLLKIRTDYYQNKKANGYERNDRKHDEDPLSAPSHPGFDDLWKQPIPF